MLSTTIFTMVTLGVYTILIKSYQMIALSRCRDEARRCPHLRRPVLAAADDR